MNALVFLGAAVALSVLGSLVIGFRNRTTKTQGDGVSDFSALMQALAPDDQRRSGQSTPPPPAAPKQSTPEDQT